jgi:hypothetical protein
MCTGIVDECVVTAGPDFSVLSPQSTPHQTEKEPFCSSFRPSISQEPSHLTFNQKNKRMNPHPEKYPMSNSEEYDADEDSNQKGNETVDSDEHTLHNSSGNLKRVSQRSI